MYYLCVCIYLSRYLLHKGKVTTLFLTKTQFMIFFKISQVWR